MWAPIKVLYLCHHLTLSPALTQTWGKAARLWNSPNANLCMALQGFKLSMISKSMLLLPWHASALEKKSSLLNSFMDRELVLLRVARSIDENKLNYFKKVFLMLSQNLPPVVSSLCATLRKCLALPLHRPSNPWEQLTGGNKPGSWKPLNQPISPHRSDHSVGWVRTGTEGPSARPLCTWVFLSRGLGAFLRTGCCFCGAIGQREGIPEMVLARFHLPKT